MNVYQSKKRVEAGAITTAEFDTGGGGTVRTGGQAIKVPPGFTSRGTPAEGDYLIRSLPDGYLYWQKKQLFEDGFAPVDA